MPYAWAIGLIWCGLHDSVIGAAAWCALFVFGVWLIEMCKPIMRLLRDRDALAWTVEVAIMAAASNAGIHRAAEGRPVE